LVNLFRIFIPTLCSDLHLPKPKATKSPKKSATKKKPTLSKASSPNIDLEDDFDDRPITPEPVQRKLKKSSVKPLPTKTDDESDDLAIKKTKAPKQVNKGRARATESPPETFESAGTDGDLEDPRSRPSNMNPLSVEEKSLRDAPPGVHKTTTMPIISQVVSNRGDVSEEEQKPPLKKRGRPRKDKGEEEPPPKRGKVQKVDDGAEGKGSTKSKPKRQAKKSSPKPKSTATKGRTRKKVDPPPDTGDEGKEEYVPPETTASGSNTRKRQRRTLDDGLDDEKWDEPDDDEPTLYPNRVRLDSIPPEGVVIRKKNGIVERLLPPVMCVRFRRLRWLHLTFISQ
jgi:hypothetical protein